MADISAKDVKALRDATGAGMMDALTERAAITLRAERDAAERSRWPPGLAPAPDDVCLNDHEQRVGPQPPDETPAVADLPVISAAALAE